MTKLKKKKKEDFWQLAWRRGTVGAENKGLMKQKLQFTKYECHSLTKQKTVQTIPWWALQSI